MGTVQSRQALPFRKLSDTRQLWWEKSMTEPYDDKILSDL